MPPEDQRSALLRASIPPPRKLFGTLITANHILHHHNVVDAYGHISVRNPQNPQTFFLSRSLAPALVSRKEDLEEYRVEDASPVNKDAPKGYAERFIHSEVYKKYSGVNSVVHAHNESVLPFSITSVPLRPVYHMGGVMGEFENPPQFTDIDRVFLPLLSSLCIPFKTEQQEEPNPMQSNFSSIS